MSNYNPNSIRNHPISLLMYTRSPDGIIRNDTFKCITEDDNNNSHSLSLVCRPYPFDEGSFVPEGRKRRPILLGSCNGLVALYKCPGDFLLFNPCTKQEKRVRGQSDVGHPILWRSLSFYGLFQDRHDHDHDHDHYKVVMGSSRGFYVVSLNDGSFKCIPRSQGMENEYLSFPISARSTLVRGVPHWACHLNYYGELAIFFYDCIADDQKLHRVLFPKERAEPWNPSGLGALDGQLIVARQVESLAGVEVWALNQTSDWSILFVIANVSGPPLTLVSRVTDDHILIAGQCLVLYNLRNRSSRHLLNLDQNCTFVSFIPSLVSPNHS